ncbi:hypothetical protein K439DRAFT_1505442 [Ramaria rubella]|nr:hypothetical protein K439DRAFT_1505442 [Ramaria rubella]
MYSSRLSFSSRCWVAVFEFGLAWSWQHVEILVKSSCSDDGAHLKALDEHIRHTPLTSISSLAPFSGLIITIVFVCLFLVKYYVLELFFLRKIYGKIYTDLDELNRRGFVNHHIAGTTKFIILIVAAYPFLSIAFGTGSLHDPSAKGSIVTLGDILLVATQMLLAMYIFELIYRTKVSPVSIFHHIGAIMVGQSAVAFSLNVIHQKDASIEFILCTVWGTIVETIVTMYLFGQLWSQWRIAFKIVTPLLHVAFSAAQLHGTRIFFRMWKKQERIIDGLRAADVEAAPLRSHDERRSRAAHLSHLGRRHEAGM